MVRRLFILACAVWLTICVAMLAHCLAPSWLDIHLTLTPVGGKMYELDAVPRGWALTLVDVYTWEGDFLPTPREEMYDCLPARQLSIGNCAQSHNPFKIVRE